MKAVWNMPWKTYGIEKDGADELICKAETDVQS